MVYFGERVQWFMSCRLFKSDVPYFSSSLYFIEYVENQLPVLPGSALKFSAGFNGVVVLPITLSKSQ
jgi:hypothetical protein